MGRTKLKRLQNNYLAHKEKNPKPNGGVSLGTGSSGPSDIPTTLTVAMRSRTTDTHKIRFEQGKTRSRRWVLEEFLGVNCSEGARAARVTAPTGTAFRGGGGWQSRAGCGGQHPTRSGSRSSPGSGCGATEAR